MNTKIKLVTKVIIDPITKTAVGVNVMGKAQTRTVLAKKEVILAAGSVDSAKILMMSGIGPRVKLESVGIQVIKEVREFSKTPIIVLSVRSDERDKIMALDLGANDYVIKPFNIRELLARARSALRDRLSRSGLETVIKAGKVTIDLAKRIVTNNDEKLSLSPKEYYLLSFFMKNLGNVITHEHLLREAWGPSYSKENQYLRVYIGTLRQKIEPDPHRPQYKLTEPGVGYRMVDPCQET